MGADVRVENPRDVAGEPVADLVARSSKLRAITVGGDLVPLAIDEVPLVALLGLFADSEPGRERKRAWAASAASVGVHPGAAGAVLAVAALAHGGVRGGWAGRDVRRA